MDAIELSIVIERPIEESFEFLVNLENDVKWHARLLKSGKRLMALLG